MRKINNDRSMHNSNNVAEQIYTSRLTSANLIFLVALVVSTFIITIIYL